jgi:hypothetical protein
MTATAQLTKNNLFTIRRQSYAPIRPTPASLSADIDAYLARGGQITVLPGFAHDAVPLPCSSPQPYPSRPRQNPDNDLLTLPAVAELAGMDRKSLEVLIAAGKGPTAALRENRSGRVYLKFRRREAVRWLRERAARSGRVAVGA